VNCAHWSAPEALRNVTRLCLPRWIIDEAARSVNVPSTLVASVSPS
jgi:hypothetical protein